MNRFCLYAIPAALVCAASYVYADHSAMNLALLKWEQQLREYQAALKIAETDDQKAALIVPDGKDIARELWKSVNHKTGTREKLVRPTDAERMNGATDTVKQVATYQFEEAWAAPAVVWFLNHPDAFASVFGKKTRQISFFANAMLESVERVHFASPHIADACAKLSESPSVRIYEILEKIYTRNQTPAARANAALAMSILLSNPTIASAESSPAVARSKQLYFLRQAVIQAPDGAMFGSVTLNDMAREIAYALEHLSLDSVPPQMELFDKDGNKVLLPTPGQPTLLFFWTPEESIGLDIVQRQELLTKQFPNLKICPISTNMEMEQWKSMLQEYGITNAFMDNDANKAGRDYRISQLPFAVLVNERCRILFIGFPNQQLQAALNNCFAPAEDTPTDKVTIEDGTTQPAATGDSHLQPGSQPRPATPSAGSSEVPALRDMPDEAVAQPKPAQPTTGGSDEVPALREMPEF